MLYSPSVLVVLQRTAYTHALPYRSLRFHPPCHRATMRLSRPLLTELDLTMNKLADLPAPLQQLKQLTTLKLDGNPLSVETAAAWADKDLARLLFSVFLWFPAQHVQTGADAVTLQLKTPHN